MVFSIAIESKLTDGLSSADGKVSAALNSQHEGVYPSTVSRSKPFVT